ncbi:MAG: VPS10 domain-containing protein [Calditrichia bacterium]
MTYALTNSLKFLLIGLFALTAVAFAQKPIVSDTTLQGLKLRGIGPAFMSGRIADIAIHPEDDNVWYVAVGSGGVWLTRNAGNTWKPIFDKQSSYSIGCISIDQQNPHTIWVGTGENVGGRHVGYGDGIYKSSDGGKSWKNMGLKNSEHISKIVIHPENSDVIWVASQGPLWSAGGERGVYKTINGGKTWKRVLGDNQWIGATELEIDPRNPDVLYAATWQRHRNVAALMGGGPGTALYSSTDAGDSWTKLKKGLPSSNMGKIGLAISPQNPDVLYAAIELDRRKGAVYRSANRGASWKKMSDTVSGGTGPHYYQELYASPHAFDRIYLANVRFKVSDDGGKTFRTLKEKHKHSDNHSLTFRKDDPDYLLAGTDGGIYESFDLAENWSFIDNLPVTQYYKLAVDDAEPFYNIYGGTQDNNTQGGPSRTDNFHGIRNSDWYITLFGDGHQPATEPGNPDIIYSEWQQGNLVRVDRTTGEFVYIQPQAEEGASAERFNWDAPILVSPHSPTTIYFASQRVWRSDNRGDTWTALSGDLTRNQERVNLPIMGTTWGWDAPWDLYAMSTYNTITSLAVSPLAEGLIYAGTDDGLVQVSENNGKSWRKIEVGSIKGVPATAFVNDIKADLHDANTVYLAMDNHKYGDFKPYLFKSTNRGKTWRSIRANLPDKHLVWRIVQDHEKAELLFAATEFAIFTSLDAGRSWAKLSGGVPTISFRDLAIQKRENDLVGASFGRGFYVFDDYSVLREIDAASLNKPGSLYSTRKAWWYITRPVLSFSSKGSQGAGYYTAPNPPFGAVFTYHLAENLSSKEEIRKEREKQLNLTKGGGKVPAWNELESERREAKKHIWLVVRDSDNNIVRRISGPTKKGFHRIAWDLRFPAANAINMHAKPNPNRKPQGVLAAPGKYSVTLFKEADGKMTQLDGPQEFDVVPMRKGALPGATPVKAAAFWKRIATLQRSTTAASMALKSALKRSSVLKRALERSLADGDKLSTQLEEIRQSLLDIDFKMNGHRSKQQIGEKYPDTISDRIGFASIGTFYSTYGPTEAHSNSMGIAEKDFLTLKKQLESILNSRLPKFEKALQAAGAPWIEGQDLP